MNSHLFYVNSPFKRNPLINQMYLFNYCTDTGEIRTMGELQSMEARSSRSGVQGAYATYRGPSPGGGPINR